MKHNYISSFVFILLLINSSLKAQEVVNGGFELSNQQGMARNWITDDAKGQFKIGLSKTEFHSGKHSLELNGTAAQTAGNTNGIAANVYGSSSSTKVKAVQLSGWIKSSGRLDTSVALFIQKGTKIIRVKCTSPVKKGWNKLVLNYEIPMGENWYRFYYGIEAQSGSQLWLDDLKLTVNGVEINDPKSLYQEPTQKQLKWLSRNAFQITQLEAGHPDQDLSQIGKAIGNASIVGIGEPTHGTSEAAKLKTRVLEYLIKQKGFTTLALEESIATCNQMNRLLNTDRPALKDSLLSMPFYKLWKTQEMLDLFIWVNRYNLSHNQKIKFIGFDMEDPGLKNSRRMLRTYGEKNNKEIYRQTLRFDKDLDSLLKLSRISMDNDETLKAANRAKGDLISLDSTLGFGAKINDKEMFFELKSYVRVCKQWIESRFFMGNRDEYIAENINIFLETHPDEKIFLWAHNFHVANVNTDGQKTMGCFLKEKYKGNYFPFSITTGGGSFMAAADYAQKKWNSYNLERPYPGTYEYVFSKISPDNYFLNFSAGIEASAASWLNIPMKQLDQGYIYDGDENYIYHATLRQSFDGLFFIRNTTASHSLIR